MYKTEFHALENAVEALHSEKRESAICERLQQINEKFLREYIIQIGAYTIEPLLVEAYYCEPSLFPDCNSHKTQKQKNRFGKLYFHERGRGGVDICLSRGDYYYSLLLKDTLVTAGDGSPRFHRQTALYQALRQFKRADDIVLKKRETAGDGVVFHTIRKGLTKDNGYNDKKIAAVTGFELRDKSGKRYRFDLERGHPKASLVCEYIKSHPGEFTKAEFKKEFLDYVPKGIKGLLK